MILSEIGRGKIYAGHTKLASSLVVTETGAMEITVSSGSFTNTGNLSKGVLPQTYSLLNDAVCPVFNTEQGMKYYAGELVESQWQVDILWRSWYMGQDKPLVPSGFTVLHYIIFPFLVPPNTESLADISIYCLQVLAGFPDGTDGSNWDGIQTGTTGE